jgi:hypothetical protein
MSEVRTYHQMVGEISQKAWKIRDLLQAAESQKTASEQLDLTKSQRNTLRATCKTLCDDIRTTAIELKAYIKDEV